MVEGGSFAFLEPTRARLANVMEHLGLTPGPEIGKALAFLMEIRLEEGLIGEEALLKRLDEWYALQQ